MSCNINEKCIFYAIIQKYAFYNQFYSYIKKNMQQKLIVKSTHNKTLIFWIKITLGECKRIYIRVKIWTLLILNADEFLLHGGKQLDFRFLDRKNIHRWTKKKKKVIRTLLCCRA